MNLVVPGIGFIVLIIAILVVMEAFIMRVTGLNPFRKAFMDSIMVNITSILLGMLIILVLNHEPIDEAPWLIIIPTFFILVCLAEAAILKLLNKSKPFTRLIFISLLMNLSSCLIFYLFIRVPGWLNQ